MKINRFEAKMLSSLRWTYMTSYLSAEKNVSALFRHPRWECRVILLLHEKRHSSFQRSRRGKPLQILLYSANISLFIYLLWQRGVRRNKPTKEMFGSILNQKKGGQDEASQAAMSADKESETKYCLIQGFCDWLWATAVVVLQSRLKYLSTWDINCPHRISANHF